MSKSLYIDTPEALRDYAARIADSPWLALDTEFMREKTYFPQLCLLQISNGEVTACIDPLVLDDLQPLYGVLFNTEILKIFHAARQDLEIFFNLIGKLPAPVFDTQIAASLAGYPDQVGYAVLVKDLLDVDLDKSHARADWARRPLPQDAIRYAADDVEYLGAVYRELRERLSARNRLEWMADDLQKLADPATYRADPENAWQRIRGIQKLKPRQLGVLAALAKWREEAAVNTNKPRQWIVRDEVLLDIARRLPRTSEELAALRGVQESFIARRGGDAMRIIQDALGSDATIQPPEQRERLTPEQEALADMAMAMVRLRSAEQQISPANLVSRRELERLVRGERELPILQGWRKAAAGDALLQLLEGKALIRVKAGKPVLE